MKVSGRTRNKCPRLGLKKTQHVNQITDAATWHACVDEINYYKRNLFKKPQWKNPRTLAHVFTLNRETQKHPHSCESLIKVKHLDLLQDADQSGDAWARVGLLLRTPHIYTFNLTSWCFSNLLNVANEGAKVIRVTWIDLFIKSRIWRYDPYHDTRATIPYIAINCDTVGT